MLAITNFVIKVSQISVLMFCKDPTTFPSISGAMASPLTPAPLSSDPHIGEPQIVASAPGGGVVEFTNYLWNLGTEPNSYEVTLETKDNTFPAESLYCLSSDLDSDCTSFVEARRALVFEEGEIAPGTHKALRLFVKLPSTVDKPDSSYGLVLKATDTSANSTYEVEDTTRNILVTITGSATSSMDMTLDQPLDHNGSLGEGEGPETKPLKNLQGQSGTTLVFDHIYINNTGNHADNYLLEILPGPDNDLPKSF